ncbi:MAG: translocation/assembly module TamB [Spirochaetaceae bacterium]|jgi:hypothetical protein|nr:translocation/assembly module TamB [Spirochaetaceae bacterium]
MSRKSLFDIRIVLFLALVAMSAAALRPVQRGLFARAAVLQRECVAALERLLGKTVTYGSMSPSILGAIDIKNIEIYGGEDDLFSLIKVKRLRAGYSLAGILSPPAGEGRLDALRLVDAKGFVIEMKTEKDVDGLFDGGSGGNLPERIKDLIGMAPKNLDLRLSDGVIRFTAGKSEAALEKAAFSARLGDKILRFSLSARADAWLERPARISAAFSARIDGVYDRLNGASDMKVSFSGVKTSYFNVNRLELLARLTGDSLRVQKIGDKERYDLQADYSFADSFMRAKASFADFAPSRALEFSPELKSWNRWLGTRLSGNATASFGKTEGLAYTASLRGTLDRASPVGSGSFVLDADGDAGMARFDRLELSMPRGGLVWRGSLGFKPLMPTGELALNDFSFASQARGGRHSSLNGNFLVSSSGSAVNFFAETFMIGHPADASGDNVELQAVDITVDHAGDNIDFSMTAFRIKNAESYDEASFSPITLDGSIDFGGKSMEARLEIETISMSDILKMTACAVEIPHFPLISQYLLDNIMMTSEIFVSTDFKDFLYNVPHFIVAWEGGSNIWASLSLSGNGDGAELSEGRIVWNGKGINILASAMFENLNDMLFNAELRTNNGAYTFQASLLEKNSLNISSSLGIDLNVNLFQRGAFAGLLLADAPRFPLTNGYAEVSAEVGFRYDFPGSWNVNVERFKISGLKSAFSADLSATVEFAGSVNQSGANFGRIYFDDGRGAMYGGAAGVWEGFFTGGEASFNGNVGLRTADNVETLDAEVRYDEGSLFVWAEVSELQSGRFFGGNNNMFITGDIGFFKTQENWSAAVNLSSLRGVFQGQPVTLSGSGSFDNARLDISDTSVSYGAFFADIPFLNINLSESSLNSSAHIWGNGFSGDFNTEMNMNASFAKSDSWSDFKSALKSFDLLINFENTVIGTFESKERLDFKLSRNGNIWNAVGGLENMARLQINENGDFFAAFSYPMPVIGTMAGFIRNGEIDAEANSLYIDVSRFWPYMPTDSVSISGGFVVADIRISGPLNDPEFFGTASVNSLRLGIRSLLADEIGPIPAFLTFNGNEIRLEPLNVRAGNGEGVIRGSFIMSRWLPMSFDMSIALSQKNPVRLNTVIAGFFVDGTVFGRLNLNSDGQTLKISGEIGSDNAEISLAASSAEEGENGDRRGRQDIQTDLSITAGRKVAFLWPNMNIPILQAYAAAGSSIRIVNDTLSGNFSITGDIEIRGGEVFYFQRSFYIKEGQMNFNESEVQFDPRFSAVAETRDRANNEPVTISMIIENQPLSSFTPRFEASPALSQAEIFMLLGDKLSGDPSEDSVIQRAFVSSTADVLAQFGVVRRFERAVRDFLHIDMFSLRTQALQNAILLNMFRDTNRADDAENARIRAQNDPRIGNYFDNTTVFLGKYIGAGLFLQAMLSLRYDPLRANFGGMRVEPDLSVEFRGPLFDIRWDLTPTLPENAWVSDNKITLSKKWTLP